MDGPSKVHLDCEQVQCGYQFRFRPLAAGVYVVTVKYAGDSHIPGSPFLVNVTGVMSLAAQTDRQTDRQTVL